MPTPLEESFINEEANRWHYNEQQMYQVEGKKPELQSDISVGNVALLVGLITQTLPILGGIIGEKALGKIIHTLLPNHPGIESLAELVGSIGGAIVGDPSLYEGKSAEEVEKLISSQTVQSELNLASKEGIARAFRKAQQLLGTTGQKDTDAKLSLFDKLLNRTHHPPTALINATLMNPRISIQKVLTDSLNLPVQQAFKGVAVAGEHGPVAGAKTLMAGLWAYRQAGKDALKYAMRTFIENKPVFQEDVLGIIDKGSFGVEDEAFNQSAVSHTWRLLGSIMRVGSKSVMAADQFAKAISYRAELNTNAYIAGLEEAQRSGLVGGVQQYFAEQYAEHLVSNPPDWLHEKAVQNMFKLTFTDDTGISKAATQLANAAPFGRWFVPYIRTPLNLAKEGFKMSPLGIFQPDIWQNTDKLAQSTAIARWGAGMLIYDWIGNEVEKGNITGDGPPGKGRELWPGYKHPRSIKIGDSWYSYEHLGPFAEVLSMAADSREMYNSAKEPDVQGKLIDTVGKVLSEQVTHLPFLQEVYNTMHALDSYKEGGTEMAAKEWAARETTSFIPAPVRIAAQIDDPVIRHGKNYLDMIKENIPGWSTTIPARTDHFGHDMYHPIGYDPNKPMSKTSLLINQINPIPSYPDTKLDAVDLEAHRLNYTWNPIPDFFWKSSGSINDPNTLSVPLSPNQQHEWSAYTGHEAQIGGKNQHDMLQWLINTPIYKQLNDNQKKQQWQQIHSGYVELGRKYMMQKYPNLMQQEIQKSVQANLPGVEQ